MDWFAWSSKPTHALAGVIEAKLRIQKAVRAAFGVLDPSHLTSLENSQNNDLNDFVDVYLIGDVIHKQLTLGERRWNKKIPCWLTQFLTLRDQKSW